LAALQSNINKRRETKAKKQEARSFLEQATYRRKEGLVSVQKEKWEFSALLSGGSEGEINSQKKIQKITGFHTRDQKKKDLKKKRSNQSNQGISGT